SIPNSEVKRISADGSVGLPHVRVGHCQVPLRRTRLTAGFLLSEPEKIMGSEYINPYHPSKTLKWGQSTLLRQIAEPSQTFFYPALLNQKMYSDPNIKISTISVVLFLVFFSITFDLTNGTTERFKIKGSEYFIALTTRA
ncbi:hypothetical protein, partial [Alteromonas portus]|uniref:hypothetical protein n=1 Tax=Alteromonas portus TaxID=2565549 RepID=UPI00196A5C68